MKRVLLLILILLSSACLPIPDAEPTPTTSLPYRILPEENPYTPRQEDVNLSRAGVTITSINLSERFDLTPSRVTVAFLGYMPGVCNELRIDVKPPDESRRILIEAYSLADSDHGCEKVFQQFEAHILLGVYSPGRYTIWVNEILIGDFVTY